MAASADRWAGAAAKALFAMLLPRAIDVTLLTLPAAVVAGLVQWGGVDNSVQGR
eukprot:CAMPEP_0171113472 /NCGR_PEP_ID=MMETSP0766_2-20121228/82510_1 /TAXON_ID=439317 /ORGANISM="Gambierdiscus australes, Strain CAWD 149" /LENGTH=53 /DNA_ID=CAMNT_0011575679 /DNA_START=17 /DNA_END=178 /DNA_ORIENTATION=+